MQLKQDIILSAWKSVSKPQIIAHYFKLLGERSVKFASRETLRPCAWTYHFRSAPNSNS